MERLTKKVVHNNTETVVVGERMCVSICTDRDEYDCEGCPVQDAFQKLASYEDAEEAGMLIKLPVAVGQKVWRIGKVDCQYCNDRHCDDFSVCPTGARESSLRLNDLESLGKTIFATREEAEKALETANES